jgi:hypothetical protein
MLFCMEYRIPVYEFKGNLRTIQAYGFVQENPFQVNEAKS